MQDSKLIPAKLLISLLVPMLIVTLGGLLVYKTAEAFFFPSPVQVSTESNGPAVIYYALTLVIAMMFFLMRQKYKWYEIIAFSSLSLVYSLSLQRMTPGIHRPVYLYFIPLILLFILIWLILKYIFLNKRIRSMRLLLFSLLSSAAFTMAFGLQYAMLKQPVDSAFLQSRFFSGLMLFIFIGFGLSLAEFIIIRLENKPSGSQSSSSTTAQENDTENDGKTV
jgi:hypothetical protein